MKKVIYTIILLLLAISIYAKNINYAILYEADNTLKYNFVKYYSYEKDTIVEDYYNFHPLKNSN